MTTNQDHVGCILQMLAAITLSNPDPEALYKLAVITDKIRCSVDPEGRNTVVSIEDAKEILADYLDQE